MKSPQFPEFKPDLQFTKPKIAYKTGGVHMNQEKNEQLANIFLDVSQQVTTKIMKGQLASLDTVSKPIVMCHPLTVNESQCLQFLSIPKFFTPAANSSDPVQRMKLVVAGILSSLNVTSLRLENKLPLDPQLGETLQQIAEDGTQFYAEAINRNPTTILYQLIGPNECYKLHGSGKYEGEFIGVNTLRCYKRGKNVMRFKGGEEIQITNPIMEVSGAIQGDRVTNYIQQMVFADKKNSLLAEVTFQKEPEKVSSGYFGKIKGMFGSNKGDSSPTKSEFSKTRDNLTIEIMNYQKNAKNEIVNRKLICKGSGSWLSYLEIDGVLYWRIEDQFQEWKSVEQLLPSDSLQRLDKKYLQENNLQEAQKLKIQSDEKDNDDNNLRKKFQKK